MRKKFAKKEDAWKNAIWDEGDTKVIRTQQRYDHALKVIVVGDQLVGKTNLTMRFCSEDYTNQCYMATIGIDFKVKVVEVNGKRVKLQIWDTAGQERFKSISRIYFRGAEGVLFVFDVTSYPSFDSISSWVTTFNESNGSSNEVEKILIGNKCDESLCREVSEDLAKATAQRLGMRYFETSSITGENVEAAFHALAEEILTKQNKEKMKTDKKSATLNSVISQMQLKMKQCSSPCKNAWAQSRTKCKIL